MEGFVDRQHEYRVFRSLVSRVGTVLELVGPAAEAIGRLAQASACAWIPNMIPGVVFEPRRDEFFEERAAFTYVPGVSLLTLLAQSRASRRPLPVQAAVVALHDAALGVEAAWRARGTLEEIHRFAPVSGLSVRIGFDGGVSVLPLLTVDAQLRDIIGAYPISIGQLAERGVEVGPPFSPEGARGAPTTDSEPVFFLGALLAIALGGNTEAHGSDLDRLMRMVRATQPWLPDEVPAQLRDLILHSSSNADQRLPHVGAFAAALRTMFDLPDGRVALSAHVRALFPIEHAAQLSFAQDGRHEQPTHPGVVQNRVGRVEKLPLDAEVHVVTHGDFARFLAETGAERPAHFVDTPEIAGQPLIMVSHAQAAAYCRWRGRRLPSEHEWAIVSREKWCLDLGRVWEWTADVSPSGGFVVRGGPWRNQSGPGLPDHASWETAASPDVGFRCVFDRSP